MTKLTRCQRLLQIRARATVRKAEQLITRAQAFAELPASRGRLQALRSRARDLAFLLDELLQRRCRICGCTRDDCEQCVERTGDSCSWVEADLCSACLPHEGEAGQEKGLPQ